MNVHFFADSAEINARFIDKRRISALAKEALQLVNNGLYWRKLPTFWAVTHLHHPASLWTADSPGNVAYLLDYADQLIHQARRLNWETSGLERGLLAAADIWLKLGPNSSIPMTQPANCARHMGLGLDYTHLPIHAAYKHYMCQRWLGDIKGGFMPRWVDEVPTFIESINPRLHDYLIAVAKTPLGTKPAPDPRMFTCPVLGQPVTPPHIPEAERVVVRRVIQGA